MNINLRPLFTTVLAIPVALSAWGQAYTYLPEGFEGEEWQANKPATVTSSTGKWTTFKNQSSADNANSGARSLYFSAKDGIQSPELPEGAGTAVYYIHDSNRQMMLESSRDGVEWTYHEAYKVTAPWTRHAVEINDPMAKYVRLRSTSNGNVYVDDLLITKPDGTDGEGNVIATSLRLPYFTQDFEDQSTYPKSKPETETTCEVAGQGEWKYLLAYRNTNSNYIPDQSSASLRLLKNGSHVISPVLQQGVVKIEFDEGRGNRKLKLYTSKDAGATWNPAADIVSETYNTVSITDKDVNRVKLANESSSDADIDNLVITAFPAGVPATVGTCTVSEIGPSGATARASVADEGEHPLLECGFCWSTEGVPSVSDNAVKAETAATSFTAQLTGLPADTEITMRAYALTLAGAAYGEPVRFSTSAASPATVGITDMTVDDIRSDDTAIALSVTAIINDLGGSAVTEAGVVYSTSGTPTTDDEKATAAYISDDNSYTVYLRLKPETAYFIAPYAVNSAGTAYGDTRTYTTEPIVVPDYPHNVYYCDPEGDDATADGSAEAPFHSLQKAVDLVVPGDTIYMNAGTYAYSQRINIPAVGERGSGMIALHSRGGRAVLDFSQQTVASANQGIRLTGSYWHFYGLDIINAGDNGLLIERNKPSGGGYAEIAAATEQAHDNVIENCAFIRNADTGLQMKNLASFNKVINCDSYYNTDPSHGDADGFAVKISHGDGNYFYGCRAWQNSDDGWDQFIKNEGGFPDDITTTLEYCWAFRNGILESGEKSNGNGNGFKMGSNQGRNNVVMNRCLAFENVNKGFDQNHNTGHMILNNCSGYSSKDTASKSRYTYRLDESVATGHIIRLTNCVAISDGISDRTKSDYAPWSVQGEIITSNLNTLPEDYKSIDWSGTTAPRNEDGSLPAVEFMHIRENSARLIDTGSAVKPFDGESHWAEGIVFNGEAPDLGCFETGNPDSGVGEVTAKAADRRLELFTSRSGLCIATLKDAGATDSNVVIATDMTGRIILRHAFTGATTTFRLPDAAGVVAITVITPDGPVSAKTMR